MNERLPLRAITSDGNFFSLSAALALRVPQAKDAAEVAALLGEAATLFGADAAAFASFVKDDESYESYRFVLACDALWCMEYESGAHYMHDPWLEYARHHAEPVLAEHVHARTPKQQAVVRLAAQFGFTSVVIIPAHSPQGLTRLGALCLGSAQPGYFASEGVHAITVAAMPLAMRLHDWQIGTLRKELQARARLTDDDIALLHLERQGKGSKQIAAAMNTTSTSIDSRWQRLNAKLGVSTRQAASRLAAEYGLV
jgi:DNA-binding CsgD family transcriptional regulator